MSKSLRNTFLKSCISKALRLVALFVGATSLYFTAAEAKVCFLPGGVCPGELTAGSIKATQNEQCLGYNLTQIKCNGMACQSGWDCKSCTNGQGTFYKCDKVPTPEPEECGGDTGKAWTPGLEECDSSCQRYDSCGFTGNKINGKCSAIPEFTSVDPGDCYSYIMPEYVYKVEISGADVTEGSRNDCYTNIVKMSGYTTTKPASCMTYNSKLDGLGKINRDTMCYTAGVSIGEYFSTETRDSTVFTIETKYGIDTFTAANGTVTNTETEACYRAIGCNAANGWLAAKDVDGTVYEYLEKTSDGVTCRKAIGCKESEQWFNYEKLGQYKGKHFMTDEKSINIGGGNTMTCYRAGGCHNRAYTSQPDARYFKFDKQSSNEFDCWIVTGKADYAYEADDRETSYFDYTSATAYLNGTDTQVTYYIVNKDNGRNGCMQYAYESAQDTRYFVNASVAQYSNGSSTKKTCYNVTGKSDYAYDAGDRKTTYFDYTSATAYLNGTATQGTYYIVNKDNGRNGCMQYAYESEPDAKYFASNSEEQYSNGSDTKKKCWNITGRGAYAYKETEKNTKFFAYDSGKEGYLNGTSTTERYFDILSCGTYAYPNEPEKTHFVSQSETGYKGGVETPTLTCYNVTSCSEKAYDSKADTAHFAYDNGKKRYFNGTGNEQTCYNALSCREKWAYESKADTTHFKYDEAATAGKAYFAGAGDQHTCYKLLGCGDKAYQSKADSAHFAYDGGKTSYFEGNAKTCYNATGCANNIVLESGKDTDHFSYDGGANAYFNGDGSEKKCYIPNGCSANAVKTKNNNYFNYDAGATQNGHTCYKVEGCKDPAVAESGKDKHFNYDEATSGTLTCFKAKGCSSDAVSSKDTTHFTYDSGVTQNGHTCYSASGCNTDLSVLAANRSTAIYTYDGGATQNGYNCFKVAGCNGTNNYSAGAPDATYFTKSVDNQGNVTCYKATGCVSTGGVTGDKPSGCRTWSKVTVAPITCYYNVSAEFGTGCVTADKRTACYKYSAPKANSDGVIYYFNPSIMETGATANKPSVTDNDCHTFSSGNPSANNGTSTICYWNDNNVTSSKPTSLMHCGTCGKKTRTPSCKSDGTGWSEPSWSGCTEFTKPATTKTESKADSTGCTESGTCSDSTSCTETKSCSDSTGCTETSSSGCSCGATKTYSGTKYRSGSKTYSGTKYRSGSKTYTGKKYRDVNYQRSVTCNNDGTGYTEGSWTVSSYGDYGSCTDGSWSNCNYGNWGSCTDGSWGSCSYGSWGSCTDGSWGSCSGGSDYKVDTESTGCGCGGTKTRTKYCQTGWGDWSACSKSGCSSGHSCVNGSCLVNTYFDGTESCNCTGTRTKVCALDTSTGKYSCVWSECSEKVGCINSTCCNGKCKKSSYVDANDTQSCGCGGTQSKVYTLDMSTCDYTTSWGSCSKDDCPSGYMCSKKGNCINSCPKPTCANYGDSDVTAVGTNYSYQVSGFVKNCANEKGIPATSDALSCSEGNVILIRCCY